MNKSLIYAFIIQDMVQGDEKGNFYWYGNYTNKQWSSDFADAKQFATKQDAISALKEITDNFGGHYQIIKIYT